MKRNSLVFSFDWPAFLLLPAWLGYRRQWTMRVTLVGLVALMSLVAGLARIELPSGAFGGALFALGLMAQGLLLTHANGLYYRLKRDGLDDSAISAALTNKASPSIRQGFVAAAGALVMQLLAAFLLSE